MPDADADAAQDEGSDSAPMTDGKKDETAESPPVKDRDDSVLAYLPESYHDDWDLATTHLELTWKSADMDASLDKLRHVYPILMAEGANNAQDLTAEEIQEHVERINEEDRENLL